MNTRGRFGVAGALVVLMALLSAVAAPELPAEMASHWNAAGEPDGTLPKTAALALLPGLAAVLLGLLAAFPAADPLGENIESFRAAYDWFVVVFVAVLATVHVGIVAYNLGYRFPFVSLVLVCVAVLLYYAGVVLERAEQNWIIGIRTPWTLASEEVWDRTHAVGAPLFKLSALSTLVGAAFPTWAPVFVVAPVLVTAIVTTVYSYVQYERVVEKGAE